MLSIGTRVTRLIDNAHGTIEQASIYDGRPLYGVRLDKDGEIWQGNDGAWIALI